MAQISATQQPGMQQIDLTSLPIQHLQRLKAQLDQELQVLTDSVHTLKVAQTRFQESGLCLQRITPESKDKDVMVPLTGSMYVSGRLADVDNVLVDVGTGYYAKKSIGDAKNYFERRVAYVTEQMEKCQLLGLEKAKIQKTTAEVLEIKMAQAQKQLQEKAEKA